MSRLGFYGVNVGVVDERGELASVSNGVINLDLGKRCDVLSNCPKSIGINMLVRSMGINVVATDEIGTDDDIEAIKYAFLSGIKLVFTMHGKSLNDILLRDKIKELIDQKLFELVIILENKGSPGMIKDIHEIGGGSCFECT